MTMTAERSGPGPFKEILVDYPKTWTEEGTSRRHVNFAHCIVRNGHGLDLSNITIPHDRFASLVLPAMRVGVVGIVLMVLTGLGSLFLAGTGRIPDAWSGAAAFIAVIGIACFVFAAAILTSPRLLLRPVVRRWEARNMQWWDRNSHLITEVMRIGGSRGEEVTALVFDLHRIVSALNELTSEELPVAAATEAIDDAMDAIWGYIDETSLPDNKAAEELTSRIASAKVASVFAVVKDWV